MRADIELIVLQAIVDIVVAEGLRAGIELLDLDGELVRYIDPAVLVASGAQLLAEKGESMDENRAAAEPIRVVTFQLGGEEFGLDIMKVFEVLPVPELRPVPNSPEFV